MALNRSSVWVLGDQLNIGISSLEMSGTNNVVMVESCHKCSMGTPHKRRVAFILSSMRHFRDELKLSGYDVDYYEKAPDFLTALKEHVKTHNIKNLYVMKPRNRPGTLFIDSLKKRTGIDIKVADNNLFMCSGADFAKWMEGRKVARMEHFYRMMRRKWDVLMKDGQPVGGSWNYDKENRKKLPGNIELPDPMEFDDDAITRQAIKEVNERFQDNFGELKSLNVPVTRKDALRYEQVFIDRKLPLFGSYEDSMTTRDHVLFHSRTSMFMNVGLLLPEECIRMAEKAYYEGKAAINSVEGYIRQILGWREFMAGRYSRMAHEIYSYNFFNHKKDLPEFYWDESQTDMNCIKHAVKAVRETGYTHHIIRLMVLGNYALIYGVEPKQISDWFLEAYEDAYEWVVTPNVICMSQYADGGKVAAKPYASTAAYIDKMSDYCEQCVYSPKNKEGIDACPFNVLYHDFINRNKKQLIKNPQMRLIVNRLTGSQ